MKLEPCSKFHITLGSASAGANSDLQTSVWPVGELRIESETVPVSIPPVRRLLQQYSLSDGYLLLLLTEGDRAFFDGQEWALPGIESLFMPSLLWPCVGDCVQVRALRLSPDLELVDDIGVTQQWCVTLPEDCACPPMQEVYSSAQVIQTGPNEAELEIWRCARFRIQIGPPRRLPNLIKRLRSWLSFGADDYHGITHIAGDGSIRMRFAGRLAGPKYKDSQFNWNNINQILGHENTAP